MSAAGDVLSRSPSLSGKPTVKHKAQVSGLPGKERSKSQYRQPADNAIGALEVVDAGAPGLRGEASFYGQHFSGRQTASGERFDGKLFTGASNRFPLGSWVAVRRLDNERCAIVKINDRMSAKQRLRVIDVSLAVAQYLDMLRAGVVLVRVTALKAGAGEKDQDDCHAATVSEKDCLSCGQPEKLPDFSQAFPPQD